jgi:hypothetical protein
MRRLNSVEHCHLLDHPQIIHDSESLNQATLHVRHHTFVDLIHLEQSRILSKFVTLSTLHCVELHSQVTSYFSIVLPQHRVGDEH